MLPRLFRAPAPAARASRTLRACLLGEQLEDRCVPAATIYKWDPAPGTALANLTWGRAANWKVHDGDAIFGDGWETTTTAPGSGPEDYAEFRDGATGPCDVTQPVAVAGLRMFAETFVTLRLGSRLTVTKLDLLGGYVRGREQPGDANPDGRRGGGRRGRAGDSRTRIWSPAPHISSLAETDGCAVQYFLRIDPDCS